MRLLPKIKTRRVFNRDNELKTIKVFLKITVPRTFGIFGPSGSM